MEFVVRPYIHFFAKSFSAKGINQSFTTSSVSCCIQNIAQTSSNSLMNKYASSESNPENLGSIPMY